MHKIRIGIVGSGAIAKLSHLPAIDSVSEAECVAIYDVDRERADALADGRDIKVFDSYEELLDSGLVNAVIVATPNVYHKANIIEAAKRGIHVLCEKPLTTNISCATEVLEVCGENNIVLQTGFNQRFWNQIDIAKRTIEDGIIGDVLSFRSTYRESWDVYPAATKYRYDLKLSGGACMIDLTVHRIDMARYLVGEITDVCALIKHSVIPPKVDDNVSILCNFENGAIGSICSDRFSSVISNATEIYGSDGTIFLSTETINPFQSVPFALYTKRPLNCLPEYLRKYHYPPAWWEQTAYDWICITPPRDYPYVKQLKEFCDCIKTGRKPKASGLDGYKAVEIISAAYKSSQCKEWVKLPFKEDIAPPDFS